MDSELLLALCMLWIVSTLIMFGFLCLWLHNEGECFHPHSVCVDRRHQLFSVVSSQTICQKDFAVKSISSFIAPRGSSSSKIFTALMVMLAVSGIMGCGRWYSVGDATFLQALLGQCGFAGLILVSAFEANVSPHQFYLEKLRVTCWLLEKFNQPLPFNLDPRDAQFQRFINQSKSIRHLFGLNHLQGDSYNAMASTISDSLHAIGALAFVFCIPLTIFLNDYAEEKVAWIVFSSFITFTTISYLTGEYLPVIKSCRGWILIWNPFIREPLFLLKLLEAIHEFDSKDHEKNRQENRDNVKTTFDRKMKKRMKAMTVTDVKYDHDALADLVLDNAFLRFARREPTTYIRYVGHAIMITEGLALMTPVVAMGIQWITALCDEPPTAAILELIKTTISCLLTDNLFSTYCYRNRNSTHCILKESF